MLLEFPIFSLNDDYLRAIANVMWVKIEQIQNIINQKQEQLAEFADRVRGGGER